MSDILSQDEIDALLHGVDSGAVSTEAPAAPGEARSYNFATQDRIVRGRMPTLEMINERFARLIRIGIFNLHARELRIVVRDRGPGIPEELLPRMFEPLVKGDKARTPGRGVGTGLGLALVLRIAEAHGGKAFAKNRSDVTGKVVGAEVGIVLPRS